MGTHVTGHVETIVHALDRRPDDPAVAAIPGGEAAAKVGRSSAPVREYHSFSDAG